MNPIINSVVSLSAMGLVLEQVLLMHLKICGRS